MGIINQIAEYTRLCRELSELPRNAESPEAYEPIAKRRCELLEQIGAGRKEGAESMKQYLTAAEVAETVGVSTTKAYSLIREMNAELKEAGYITIAGKIPEGFFGKKYYGYQPGGDGQ